MTARWQSSSVAMIFFVVTCVIAAAGADSNTRSAFGDAVEIYETGEFSKAHDGFKAVAAQYASPELFCNVGSAAYRMGEDGEAVLWYRRALVLDSKLFEAKQNLRFLKRRLGFLQFEARPLEQYGGFLRTPVWRFLFALFAGMAAVSLVSLVFFKVNSTVRNRLIWAIGIGIGMGCLTGIGWWAKIQQRPLLSLHVVTARDATALAAPSDSAGRVVVLPPGTEVEYLERRGAWVYAAIPGRSRGWIRASQLDHLWPFSIRLAE